MDIKTDIMYFIDYLQDYFWKFNLIFLEKKSLKKKKKNNNILNIRINTEKYLKFIYSERALIYS